jgi:hypothetical protein
MEGRIARGLSPIGSLCPDKDEELQRRFAYRRPRIDENLDTGITPNDIIPFPLPNEGLLVVADYNENTNMFIDPKYVLAKDINLFLKKYPKYEIIRNIPGERAPFLTHIEDVETGEMLFFSREDIYPNKK